MARGKETPNKLNTCNTAAQQKNRTFAGGFSAHSCASCADSIHIRGEDKLKFDVNEEAWPNADLAIHSTYEGALILVKDGDEREIKQMNLQLCSWVMETDIPPDKSILLTGWAHE